jgi:hypothetical protein
MHKGECWLCVHKKSCGKMKERVGELTKRSNGKGDAWRKEATRRFIMGWVNYCKLADMKKYLQEIDGWYRRRLRMVIWKQWKRIKTKYANLQKSGIKHSTAWEHSNTRKGYWRTAGSYILSCSITNDRLKRAGYLFFSDYYQKVRF